MWAAVISCNSNVPPWSFLLYCGYCIEIQRRRFMTDHLENVTGTTCLWYAPFFFFLPARYCGSPSLLSLQFLPYVRLYIIYIIYLNANLSAKSLPTSWGKNQFNHYMSTYIIYHYIIFIYIIYLGLIHIHVYINTTLNCRPLYILYSQCLQNVILYFLQYHQLSVGT